MAEQTPRQRAMDTIRRSGPELIEAIATVVETAEVQGDFSFDGDSSHWEDDVAMTLNALATEIRELVK